MNMGTFLLLLMLFVPSKGFVTQSLSREYSTMERCQASLEMLEYDLEEEETRPVVGYGAVIPARFPPMRIQGQCVPRDEFCEGKTICRFLEQAA